MPHSLFNQDEETADVVPNGQPVPSGWTTLVAVFDVSCVCFDTGHSGLMPKVLDDRAVANNALLALRRRPSRFTLPDGTSVRIPKAAVDGLIELLTAAAEGDEATIVRSPRNRRQRS